MGLSKSDQSTIEKARTAGGGDLGRGLDDEECSALLAVAAADLNLKTKELPAKSMSFFETWPPEALRLPGVDFDKAIENAAAMSPDIVWYFACLAKLHTSRIKYASILKTQPIPTMNQVGPRGLLQYGAMEKKALTSFLLWRKWLFDIDNRASQETGYLFEPILAASIGGSPVSAKKSPVKRHKDRSRGRQVDCIKKTFAYEFKLRITIAASGQGRWKEELDFPKDCTSSGYQPVLLVFDPTENPKLTELTARFLAEKGGAVFIGEKAWKHLEEQAGPTMGTFLKKYVHIPLAQLLAEAPTDALPELRMSMTSKSLSVTLEKSTFTIERTPGEADDEREVPDDVEDSITGP